MARKNLKLKSVLTEYGYTYESFVEKIKNDCKIKSDSGLSQRINGNTDFSQDEIIAICTVLNKSPVEIFFTSWFLK